MAPRAKLAVAFVDLIAENERLTDEADLARLRLAEALEALRPFAAGQETEQDRTRAREVLDRG